MWLDLRKGKLICNEIKSIHGRQYGNIVEEINKGLLLYARDKESLSVFGQSTNPSLDTYKTKQALKTASGNNTGSQQKSSLKAKYDEEIAEAQRQYDEVVAKYKGTPLWLKAHLPCRHFESKSRQSFM